MHHTRRIMTLQLHPFKREREAGFQEGRASICVLMVWVLSKAERTIHVLPGVHPSAMAKACYATLLARRIDTWVGKCIYAWLHACISVRACVGALPCVRTYVTTYPTNMQEPWVGVLTEYLDTKQICRP